MAPPVGFGVLSLASALGEQHEVAATAELYGVKPERVLRLGYHTYHRALDGTASTQLAAQAGGAALAEARLEAADVDFLIVASRAMPDYLNWDLSASVARELGARSVPTLLLTQGCASGVLAFQQVSGLFGTRPEFRTILLIATDRVSESHSNRMRANVESDGAAALVLRRGHDSLRWLATEQITDAEFVDFFRLEYGGTAVPVAPEGTSNRDLDPAHQVYLHFRDDPEGLVEFSRAVDTRVVDAVRGACKQAGLETTDLSRLILLNDNQASLKGIAARLGVPLPRSNAALAAALGHVGGADPLICLSIHHARGEMRSGEVVALAGMSSGMHWFCTLLEV